MQLNIVLDGMTVQSAAELIFDDPVTSPIRTKTAWNYVIAFEDFCFAYLFSDKISVSSDVVSGRHYDGVGKDLVKMLPRKFDLLEESLSRPDLSVLLVRGDFTARLQSWLPLLGNLQNSQRVYWERFMIREVKTRRPFTREPNKPDLAYLDLFVNPDLEATIDDTFVAYLQRAVHKSTTGVTSERAERFVRRCVLGHIAIFEWFIGALSTSSSANTGRIYTPCITRSSILDNIHSLDQIELFGKMIKPRVISHILSNARKRESILAVLDDWAQRSWVLKARSCLAEAALTKDHDPVKRLIGDFERIFQNMCPEDRLKAEVSINHLGLGASANWERIFQSNDPFVTAISQPPPEFEVKEVEWLLRVFPELKGGVE